MALEGAPSKQFRTLAGAPVLVQTLRAFARHRGIGPVVVVAPASDLEDVVDQLIKADLEATVVEGGATRQASVAAGVRALEDVEAVLVHDAVRPFVSESVITSVLEAVLTHGAAAAAVPVADTLRQGGAGPLFGETVPRDGLWAMQTPQGARRDWLMRAFSNAAGFVATDEVGLLQRAGYPVRIVEGDTRNVKITRPSDWEMAVATWPAWLEGNGLEAE